MLQLDYGSSLQINSVDCITFNPDSLQLSSSHQDVFEPVIIIWVSAKFSVELFFIFHITFPEANVCASFCFFFFNKPPCEPSGYSGDFITEALTQSEETRYCVTQCLFISHITAMCFSDFILVTSGHWHLRSVKLGCLFGPDPTTSRATNSPAWRICHRFTQPHLSGNAFQCKLSALR